jgi:hypothetical protein
MVPAANSKLHGVWWVRISSVLWFLGCVAFLLGLPIVLQASPLILLGIVLVATVVAGILAWFLASLRGGRIAPRWIKGAIAGTFVLTALAASPVYYAATFTQFSPAMVPQAVLSNGQKTIVFQGMQHVGTEVFYKTVVYDLEDAVSRGSVAYYEGVRPSTPADNAWFDQMITGGADLSSAYRELGEVCGLRFQSDYFGLLGRDVREHPTAHVVADVDTSQLHAEYDRLMRSDAAFAAAMRARETGRKEEDTRGLERLVGFLRIGTAGQREIGATLCRGYMTFATRRPAKDQLDKLILDYRNRVLAKALLAEPRRRIYVTYGAEHLSGVLALLRRSDAKWQVQSMKWSRTIDRQETLAGKL